MPKAFSENERSILRSELIQAGITLFGRYGFEKTSINQISETCGVAKGSFYNFFSSKESFFLDCLTETENEIDRKVITPLIEKTPDSKELVLTLLDFTLNMIDDYPILLTWQSLNNKRRFIALMSPEQKSQSLHTDMNRMEKILQKIKKTYPGFQWSAEDLVNLFRTSFFLKDYMSSLSGDSERFRKTYSTIITRGLFHDQG